MMAENQVLAVILFATKVNFLISNVCAQNQGDLNFDNEINIQDIVIIINCIINDDCNKSSDINEDNYLNILDILILVTIVLE